MRKSEVRGPKSGVRKPKGEDGTPKNKSRTFPGFRPSVDSDKLPVGPRNGDPGPGARISSDFGSRAVVIGYGNPLRSDDGIGWHASRLLAQALAGQDVEVITFHQLTPELAEVLSRCSRAVFIDADVQGKPGDIHRRPIQPLAPSPSSFTHTSTPSGLLASAKELYGHRPQAIVVTVCAETFAYGETLSPVVSAALPKVVKQVCDWIRVVPKKEIFHRRGEGALSKVGTRSQAPRRGKVRSTRSDKLSG